MDQPRCQGCGQFVNLGSDGVIDEQIPGGPRITDHKDCQEQIQEEAGSRIDI